MDRLSGLLADGPVAVPTLEAFSGCVVLKIEDRYYEQLLIRTALAEQRPLLQVSLKASIHTPQDQLGQGKGFCIAAVDGHQADIGALLGRLPVCGRPESHPRSLQILPTAEKLDHGIGNGLETAIPVTADQRHVATSSLGIATTASSCCQRF